MLAAINAYLAEQKRVPLLDLSHRFRSNPEALRGMLAVLERKGRVRKVSTGAGCKIGGCEKCDPASLEVYEWVEGNNT
jgi:hypothetical protein